MTTPPPSSPAATAPSGGAAPAEVAPAAVPSAAGSPPTTPVAETAPATPADAAAAPAADTAEAPTKDAAAAPAGDAAAEKTTDIVAGQGGVMTDEVGVVTGELTLRTALSGDQVAVGVQYKDADEWYAVTGAKATLKDPADLEAVHAVAVGILNRPEG